MRLHIFDIETAPDTDAVKEFTKPFDRDSVKVGNLKPENAKAKIDQAEATYWEKAYDKAALDPYTSEIVAIGIHFEDEAQPEILTGDEASILTEFWRLFNDRCCDTWAYYTGSNDKSAFDPRHIINRSWVNRVNVPAGVVSDRGFPSNCFVDLAQVFLSMAPYPTYCSADLCAKKLGVIGSTTELGEVQSKEAIEEGYGVAGKNVHEFFRSDDPDKNDLAYFYLTNDLAIERAIATIILA